ELHAARDAAGGFDADVAEAAFQIGHEAYDLALTMHGAPQVEPAAAPMSASVATALTTHDMAEAIARQFRHERHAFAAECRLSLPDTAPYSELDMAAAQIAMRALHGLFGTDAAPDGELRLSEDDDV
ncbi:MAG: hypothetical protein AB7I42_29060, partial [Bradyrhizobium sp.]|uniref:hypothetical protein n=1 Tax=Bradyrhizobium sp. TaxID=376 RepID=UPI003D147309